MRKRFEEFYVLPSRRPKHYEPNPFTGSKSMCKYRRMSFIWSPSPTRPIQSQFLKLKRKYKYVVRAMNLASIRSYALWDC